MKRLMALVGIVPWLLFGLVSAQEEAGGATTAALLAFFVAAALLISSMIRGRSPKLLEVTGAVVFAAYVLVSSASPAVDGFLDDYGRALSTAILAVVILVTLPVLPFSEQYTPEMVPEQYWHSPTFRSVNRGGSAPPEAVWSPRSRSATRSPPCPPGPGPRPCRTDLSTRCSTG